MLKEQVLPNIRFGPDLGANSRNQDISLAN